MAVLLVTYKSSNDTENPALQAEIETYEDWFAEMGSTWLLSTRSSPKQVWNHLKTFIDKDDKLIVANLTSNMEWCGFTGQSAHWLNKHAHEIKHDEKAKRKQKV